MKSPDLVLAYCSKPYIMFTDVSKYAWPVVLTESYSSICDRKFKTIQHPISYVHELFEGSQLNGAF